MHVVQIIITNALTELSPNVPKARALWAGLFFTHLALFIKLYKITGRKQTNESIQMLYGK
jgi:hypothetical protein